MRVFRTFPYKGFPEIWRVPTGVTEAIFECWGAAGGPASSVVDEGAVGVTNADNPVPNDDFTNNPNLDGALGTSYSNNSGYVIATRSVRVGEEYRITVGGNGGGGASAIRKTATGYAVGGRGGVGGYNGGGGGGAGAHVYQNLYNAAGTSVSFTQAGLPGAANAGQLWLKTDTNKVYRCKTKYTSGGSLANNWTLVTDTHQHFMGSSGGGGGGATDIRLGGAGLAHRILVAGGSGGSGGSKSVDGNDRWVITSCPLNPSPPFGNDTVAPTGLNKTWASRINYLSSGWGLGGLGGGTGPQPGAQTTADAGFATIAGSGGPATARHKTGTVPPAIPGSVGQGGNQIKGGTAGSGGQGVTSGVLGIGGHGGAASGVTGSQPDDFCAGGGGGGGGYYGGGGGGQGFLVLGSTFQTTKIATQGAGGGGGSSYAHPSFRGVFFAAGVRPPAPVGNSGTGANGRGGFARITYRLPPRVQWTATKNTAIENVDFPMTFSYSPAEAGGSKIDYYVAGWATSTGATFPTVQTVVQLEGADEAKTSFTFSEFLAPPAGTSWAFFVKAVDKDGDSSVWLKQIVKGIAAPPAGATITSPISGGQFVDSGVVTWTLGSQSPLVAYRLGLNGNDLDTPSLEREFLTGWRAGGSRVNLATDPGFKANAVWSSTSNVSLVTDATYPGVSGSNGKIAWTAATDGSAENHTTAWNNLIPDVNYRLLLDIASGTATDARKVMVRIEDAAGILDTYTVDLSAGGAGTYVTTELEFTCRTEQGVILRIIPSDASGEFGNAEASQITYLRNLLLEIAYVGDAEAVFDFEGGSTTGWAPTNCTLAIGDEFYTGEHSLKMTSTAGGSPSIASNVLGDTTRAVTVGQRYSFDGRMLAATEASNVRLDIVWLDAALATISTTTGTTIAAPQNTWVNPTVTGVAPANAVWARLVAVFDASAAAKDVFFDYGVFASAPRGAYFDGTNLNGNTGSVSWTGATDASASLLTGADRLSGVLTFKDVRLSNGEISLDTLDNDSVVAGSDYLRAVQPVKINPSTPATPDVELVVDHGNGLMVLNIDAADAAIANKTSYFDIFRDGIRIVTGLRPSAATRIASYTDAPASGETVVYTVRAWDSARGYTDTSDGTVTHVN